MDLLFKVSLALRRSLRHKLVNYILITLPNSLYFCWKNVRISEVIFEQKLKRICNINVLDFNETLNHDVVNFANKSQVIRKLDQICVIATPCCILQPLND